MKACWIFLLGFILVSSTAFGQHTTPVPATIVVLADSSAGEMMYLTRFHAPGLDYDRVDSAVVTNAPMVFRVIPNPMKEYRIHIGQKYVTGDIYLTPGDSLVFSYNASAGDSLFFDRVGANRTFRNLPKPWFRDRQYYRNLDSLDWYAWRSFLAIRKDSLQHRASWFGIHYPNHSGLKTMYESEAIEGYYYGTLYYLERNYWDSTGMPVTDQPNRLRMLDSIPWTMPPFAESQELSAVASIWVSLEWQRWLHAGVDTAGAIRPMKLYDFALPLPTPARDAAILAAASELSYIDAKDAVQLGYAEMKDYQHIASDTAYFKALARKVSMLQSKLPGNPAPEFSLPDTSGKLVSLKAFRGKIMYLDFWGTWCGPCLEELPELKKLQEKFSKDTSVVFVSIALEASHVKNQKIDAWKKCITENALRDMHLYADDQFGNEYVTRYGIQSVPTFMLIDRNGNFIDANAPRPSSGKAEEAIRTALSEP
jgi:thiol-disulfide isomerase/thioredoxin